MLTDFSGKKQCKLFLEKVGFKHPLKDEKLSIFLAKNTGQGVCFCGEVKQKRLSRSESEGA